MINLHRAARTLSTWHTRNVIPWCYSPSRAVPGVHPDGCFGRATALEQARQGMHLMEWFLFSPTSALAMGPGKVAHPTVGSDTAWAPVMPVGVSGFQPRHTHTVLPLVWATITVFMPCLSWRARAATHCHKQLPYFHLRTCHAHCVCPLSHRNVWVIQGGLLVPQQIPPVTPHYTPPMWHITPIPAADQ